MKHLNWCGRLARYAVGASLMLGCADWVGGATGDWPQWRGPMRDNLSTETGLLKDWPKDGPPIAWEIKGLGNGFSSVSVAEGKIFTMGSFPNDAPASQPAAPEPKPEPKKVDKKDDKNGGKTRPPRPPVNETSAVLAFDLTGKLLWKTPVGPTGEGGGYVGPRCTPTVDGDRLYALGDNGDLVCLAVDSGKEIWHANMKKDFDGRMMSGWGYSESPTIDGNKLLCCPGGKQGTVAALDKKTGALLWRSKDLTDSASYASLVPCDIGGAHQYVLLTDAHVAGIGPDGAVLWKADRKGKTAVIPTPVVKDNLVFVTGSYPGVGSNLFKIEGSSTALKAEQVYGPDMDMRTKHGGVVCIDDVVYGATDEQMLRCISLKDGALLWEDKCVGMGSIAYADGRLYVRSERGNIALVEASRAGYKEHGQFKQPDRSNRNAWPHPVIAGGKLYIRDQGILLCYDIKAK